MTETEPPRALCRECEVRQLVVGDVLIAHGRMLRDRSGVERCPGSEQPASGSTVRVLG